MPKQTEQQPAKGISGSIDGFVPEKGTRKMYHVEIINRTIDADQEVQELKRIVSMTKQEYEQFQENAPRIGARKWRLVWNPEVYGETE